MKPLTPINGEIWIDVPGFQNYQVSNHGRFKRKLLSGKEVELNGKVDRLGYRQIGLMNSDGVQKWFLAHRLIAVSFHKPESLSTKDGQFLTVNHKDRDKLNNHINNLELVTVTQNHQHWRKYPLIDMKKL